MMTVHPDGSVTFSGQFTATEIGQTVAKVIMDHCKWIVDAAVIAEREACAQIAESQDSYEQSDVGTGIGIACRSIAEAIRNQG
jgi:hypothetical protein